MTCACNGLCTTCFEASPLTLSVGPVRGMKHYNTLERARTWWHANTGLTGAAAEGRFLLGWVLETLYAMQERHRAEVKALKSEKEMP